jgi:hypothetical protein
MILRLPRRLIPTTPSSYVDIGPSLKQQELEKKHTNLLLHQTKRTCLESPIQCLSADFLVNFGTSFTITVHLRMVVTVSILWDVSCALYLGTRLTYRSRTHARALLPKCVVSHSATTPSTLPLLQVLTVTLKITDTLVTY